MTVTQPLVDKFLKLHDSLNGILVEREQEVHGVCLALATRTLFFLGKPGVAKSLTIDMLNGLIDGVKHQHLLLNNFTGPNETFGPLDLAALRAGKNIRKTDLYLPWAQTAFFDEIWKANDAILNSLLAALNERKYSEDGQWMDIPLSTMFCASNELPANESLNAIYDRIPQRYVTNSIQEPASFIKMLATDIPDPRSLTPVITWAEVEQAQNEVKAVTFDPKVFDILHDIRRELATKKGIEPSDRRFKQSLRILQGEAWLDGSDVVNPEHVGILVNVLWDRVEQQADVHKIVLDKANPNEKAVMDLLGEIAKIGDLIGKAIESADADEKQQLGLECHPKLSKASKELERLTAAAGSSRRQLALTAKAKEQLHTHSSDLISKVFSADPSITKMP
jgi:MoxR-like ATPase